MMQLPFHTAQEIAQATGKPVRRINEMAVRGGWRRDPAKARLNPGPGRAGGEWTYRLDILPADIQARLVALHGAPEHKNRDRTNATRQALWADFEALPAERKAVAHARLEAITLVDRLMDSGHGEIPAIALASEESGFSSRSIRRWRRACALVAAEDRLAALADGYRATAVHADCHEQAWTALKSDYLRPERPTFSACYRRMREAASRHGWTPIPSEPSLRRRFAAEVPAAVITLARERREKAKALYPAQRRDRVTGLHAMAAVNMDGHKFDVFVKIGEAVTRVYMVALQDLYSGKMLAWRLAPSENRHSVRLAIGDMVTRHGIPDRIVLDNGRAFTSKWITGGATWRFRFKTRDDEPMGLLTALGVETVWTTPYSGQSKPIERAFRDLTDAIARHPFCAGAYTGNTPDAKPENYGARAIPFDAFRAHVDRMIAEHNARPGRKGGATAGRSFDATFAASMDDPATVVRWPSDQQRTLWLLAAERIRAKKGNGEIEIFGNRYWHPALTGHAGKPVTVRFDPDNLREPIHVHDIKDRLICVADCIADTGFFDTEAAREHAAKRNAFLKAQRESARLHAELTPDTLAELYGSAAPAPQPEAKAPRVKRIAVGRGHALQGDWDDEAESAFSRAIRRIDAASVIEFPVKRE